MSETITGDVQGTPSRWEGDRVNVIWLEPNTETVQDLGTYTIDANLEKIETPVPDFFLYVGTEGISFVYTGNAGIGWPPSVEFAGFRFTDLSANPIQSVKYDDSSTITLGPGALAYGNNFVQVNLLETTIPGNGLLNLELFF
jgi:hypothetical protein